MKYELINESVDEFIKLETDLLNKLKDQNTNIEVVNDIMLEVMDSWEEW